VTRGQLVLEVETDKAAMDVESTTSGRLVKIAVEEGQSVDSGTLLAVIQSNESAPELPSTPGAPAAPRADESAEKKEPSMASPAPPRPVDGFFARNRAAVSLPRGGAESREPAPGIVNKLSVARRTAARRLQQSKQTIPHFYLQTSFNAEPMIAARTAALPQKLVWEAFFVKALTMAIPRFDQMACRFEDEQLVPQGTDTIGVAADIEGDLFVIPVEAPREKSVGEISRDIRDRIEAIRSGDPLARTFKPGAMTISNLGACNIETFTAIINPPESAILAIGKIRPVITAAGEAAFAVQHRANITLSVDHRVANGKYAADFLGTIVEELEKL